MSDGATRRRYDSPVRRARVAETRERILEAACALVHEFRSWDWRPLTFRAVAERAEVGERTVYRHFATEQALHDAVLQRLGQESGVRYEGLTLTEVSDIGAKVFAAIGTFAAPAWAEVDDAALVEEDERRKRALLAAVEAEAPSLSPAECFRAAAALDVLWSVPSYQRLATAWRLDAEDAAEVIGWLVRLVVADLRAP
jgi:AcrR family transcriptional regulator